MSTDIRAHDNTDATTEARKLGPRWDEDGLADGRVIRAHTTAARLMRSEPRVDR